MRKQTLLTLLTMILLSCLIEAQVDDTFPDSEIKKEMDQHNIPSIVTCVIKNNEIVWKKAYGYAKQALVFFRLPSG